MGRIVSRPLRVLQLFSAAQPLWTVEEVATALRVSTSSAYRYVQDLSLAGLLDRVQGGGYALGPAVIEMDYLIRHHDPLIRATVPAMRGLLEATTQRGTVILCRRYHDRVMCIHQEHGSLPHRPAGYERGVAMPLFVGATSRVVLASEPLRVQRRIYLENEAAIRANGRIATWKEFVELAAAIRRRGFDESDSEVTPGLHGIAAPLFQGTRLVASLSLVTDLRDEPESVLAAWREQVTTTAQDISRRLEPESLLVAR